MIEAERRRVEPWLVALAVAVTLGMQQGTLLAPLGTIGTTRVADWTDLAVPYLIVGCATMVLVVRRSARRTWLCLVVGGLLLAQGGGIHLAANSIANVDPGPTANLWDEVVGHHVAFTGLALVLAAVGVSLGPLPARIGPVGWLLAGLTGVTLFDIYVEGATTLLGFVICAGFLAAGWRWRHQSRGRLVLLVFGLAALLLAGWGIYWQGFPEFSELGWI